MNEIWTNEETALYALVLTCLEEPAKEVEVIEGEVEEIQQPPFYKRPISRRWGILLCSCFLVFSTIVSTILIVLFTATATITIMLVKKPISFQQTFPLPVTHTFPDITKTLSQTAPATGSGHQDATYATGPVTFYNAFPSPQEVAEGTLLIGTDGTHIITDETAVIPAGTLSVNGQITVSAHVTTLGSQGNIQAGDVSGPCCRDYVFARNNQFSGGQDARDFTVVSQSDIDKLTQSLSSQIDQQIQQDFAKQLPPTETLTTPLCFQNIVPTPTVGQEASTVTIRITKTCSAVSYSQEDFISQVQDQLKQIVGMKFGSSYMPVGNPQVTVSSNSVKEHSVRITAFVQGTIIYHFRKADMDTFKRLIAGKSKEQAGRIILQWRNVQLVGIQLEYSQDSLPTDPNKIKVRIKP